MKALNWLNTQGGGQTFANGDGTVLIAHFENFHPITDEIKEYVEQMLPTESLDLKLLTLLSGDDVVELSDTLDETGFLMSLGYVPIGEFDGGALLLNANDASVHVLEVEALDLSRVSFDETSEEYFWDEIPIEEASDDFEMIFEESSTQFNSIEEFDDTLLGVLKGEMGADELGIPESE